MDIKTKVAKQIAEEISHYLEEKSLLDKKVLLSSPDKQNIQRMSVAKVDDEDGYMTLLSEGSILYQDGSIRLYITKGTLKKWYDNLTDDYEGYVTTGHVDLNSTPIREGYFRKEDLKLVFDENGRADLLVKPHVNTKLSTIQDLIIQDEPFAISSEFVYLLKEITEDELVEYAKLLLHNKSKGYEDIDIPVTDNIDLLGFSFVGNPGNAKSGGYDPQLLVRNEESKLKKNIIDAMLAKLNGEEAPVSETTTEEVTPETEVAEQVVEETVADDAITLATKRIEELEAIVAELTKENAELKEFKLAKEKQDKEDEAKLEKLNALLSKVTTEVGTPVVEEEPKQVKSIFGRERFGGM